MLEGRINSEGKLGCSRGRKTEEGLRWRDGW